MSEYDDDPLVRALRAAATPDELRGEADALRAYRATFGPPQRSRRALGRLGLGGSALAVGLALGGSGVAAAYTRVLPDPVQSAAHAVLGPVGVPDADRSRRAAETAAPDDPRTLLTPTGPTGPTAPAPAPPTSPSTGSTSTGPSATPSAGPGEGTSPEPPPGRRSPSSSTTPPTSTKPSAGASPTPAPEPAPTPTPTEPPPTAPPSPPAPPADVSIAVTATVVAPGTSVTVSGTVTDDEGATVADTRVRLVTRSPGGTWTAYAVGRSGADGTVSFTTPALAESTALRLAARHGVRSEKVKVQVQPGLVVTATATTVDAVVDGAQAGDTVVLERLGAGRPERQRGVLGADGTVSFAVDTPQRRARYVVRLLHTPRHLSASGRVVVTP